MSKYICKLFRFASEVAWRYYEEEHIGKLNNSKSCDDVRTRVNRLCMASSYIGKKVELDEWHFVRACKLGDRDHYCTELFCESW